MNVAVTNVDKVLWPAAGFTKGDMLAYYERVAPVLLPHLRGRPVTLRRFPDGVEATGWYQNEVPGRPEWVRTAPVRDTTGRVWEFTLVEDVETLLWAANLGTIELHPLWNPTVLVLDLDPGPPADLADCCRLALALRERLESLGLAGHPKTSGSVGLHVDVPGVEADAQALARSLAEGLAPTDRRADRRGRVLVDVLQNHPLCSTIAPYSLRAAGWPTVSTPVTWDEVERCAAAGRAELLVFDAADAVERVDRLGDVHAAAASG